MMNDIECLFLCLSSVYFLWWNFYLNNLPIFNWVACLLFFYFDCTTWHAWFSVPPPGTEPMPPAWEAWSFNHCTDKEVPGCLSSYWVVRTLCIFDPSPLSDIWHFKIKYFLPICGMWINLWSNIHLKSFFSAFLVIAKGIKCNVFQQKTALFNRSSIL